MSTSSTLPMFVLRWIWWALAGGLLSLVPASAQGPLFLEGGGSFARGSWRNRLCEQLVRASGEADALILVDEGAGRELERLLLAQGARSARTLVLDAHSAEQTQLAEALRDCDLIVVSLCDPRQARAALIDTRAGRALLAAHLRGATVAACGPVVELCGAFSFARSEHQPLGPSSAELLLDGLQGELLPGLGLLAECVVEAHAGERARLPRLAVALARAALGQQSLVGLALDDRSAIRIDAGGRAQVFAEGSVTRLELLPEARVALAQGRAPLAGPFALERWIDGAQLEWPSGRRMALDQSVLRLQQPALAAEWLAADFGPPLHLDFGRADTASLGRVLLDDGGDECAALRGGLQLVPGEGRVRELLLVPQAFDSSAWDENRLDGACWALARCALRGVGPRIACLGSSGSSATLSSAGLLCVRGEGRASTAGALLVLDARGLQAAAEGRMAAWGATRPRQAASLGGALLWLVPPGAGLELASAQWSGSSTQH